MVKFILCLCMVASLWPVQAQALKHDAWDALVKNYVSTDALVDYKRWKQEGLGSLDAYLERLSMRWPEGMTPNARKAALINAYNATTVRWILRNYPVESVWQTPHPFTEARHMVDGEKVSLDTIESKLRKMGDPRIHAALVCAARSCPPLRREAYVEGRVDEQLSDDVRTWLANAKLNQFAASEKTARVSEIYKWYKGDFGGAGSVEKFLAEYAPKGQGAFLLLPGAKLDFIPYRWGLNDSSGLGETYGKPRFYWDYYRNK